MKRLIYAIILLFGLFPAYASCTSGDAGARDVPSPNITWNPDVGVKACDQNIGSYACNFSLIDQHGEIWQLYKHRGEIIILDFSAMWCTPCLQAASRMQALQDAYEDLDVAFVTILLQDLYGALPSSDALNAWSIAFNYESVPVLRNDGTIVDQTNKKGYAVNVLPTIILIDRDMHIAYRMDGWNELRLIDQLDIMLMIN